MIKRLFEKWFGLSPDVCETCEILRFQLEESNRERKELLHKLLNKDEPKPPVFSEDELKPVQSQFIPWRVRQQMLEAEDRQKARLLNDKAKEIAELEKAVGISEEVAG